MRTSSAWSLHLIWQMKSKAPQQKQQVFIFLDKRNFSERRCQIQLFKLLSGANFQFTRHPCMKQGSSRAFGGFEPSSVWSRLVRGFEWPCYPVWLWPLSIPSQLEISTEIQTDLPARNAATWNNQRVIGNRPINQTAVSHLCACAV